jgi:putative pyruvate formate lyase activating enzyme
MIFTSLSLALSKGLAIPIVYNSNGYEKTETLELLDGIVDIYLPDMKYGDDSVGKQLSGAHYYTHYNISAVQEMYRQVGPLIINEKGIAEKGLIIRHLVLPGNLSGTEKVLQMIKKHIGTKVHISLMGQYFPSHHAPQLEIIDRKLTGEEYSHCLELLEKYGFDDGWCQEPEEVEHEFVPDFSKQESWN